MPGEDCIIPLYLDLLCNTARRLCSDPSTVMSMQRNPNDPADLQYSVKVLVPSYSGLNSCQSKKQISA